MINREELQKEKDDFCSRAVYRPPLKVEYCPMSEASEKILFSAEDVLLKAMEEKNT